MVSKCPHCGVTTSGYPGEATPIHQEKGKRNTCPGSGKPGK
jgi:hypothetical protein